MQRQTTSWGEEQEQLHCRIHPATDRSQDCCAMRTTGAARVIDTSCDGRGRGRGEETAASREGLAWTGLDLPLQSAPPKRPSKAARSQLGLAPWGMGMTTCPALLRRDGKSAPGIEARPRFVRSNGAHFHSRRPQGCVWKGSGPMGLICKATSLVAVAEDQRQNAQH